MTRWSVSVVLSIVVTLASTSFGLGACAPCEGAQCGPVRRTNVRAGGDDPNSGDWSGGVPEGEVCSDKAKDVIGLGGQPLKGGRVEGISGADRRRTKPFELLATELARTLGKTPPSMASLASTYGEPPPRWYIEPRPTATTISATLGVAFEGCLEFTGTDAAYANVPDVSTATAACSAMARRFWNRVVTPDDIQGCVDVAVTDSVEETYASGPDGAPLKTATPARRRWAYACASLLVSTPFVTY